MLFFNDMLRTLGVSLKLNVTRKARPARESVDLLKLVAYASEAG